MASVDGSLKSTGMGAAPRTDEGAGTGGTLPSSRRADIAISILLGIVATCLLEFLSRIGFVPRLIIPAPSEIAYALFDGFRSGILVDHTISTVGSTAAGFVLGSIAALLVASLLAVLPRLERICLPYIVAFQTLPKIAIAPVLILWFGYGVNAKLAIVIAVAFFPMMLNALAGLRVRKRDELDLMNSLGASRYQIYRYIRLPNAMPYIFTGLHLGAVYSLLGAVTAEFLGSASGLGYIMLQQRASFNTPAVFAILLLLMIIGTTLHLTMKYLEHRVVFWSRDATETRI